MATVIITDEASFNGVKALVEKNLAPKNVTIENGAIRSGEDLFKLVDGSARQSEQARRGSDGSARFDVLNPKKRETKAAQTWETVLSNVLNYFYGNYSYLVYEPLKKAPDRDAHASVMRLILRLLLKNDRLKITEETDREDTRVYEVAVKFKMRLGGEPKPVLNRFYLIRSEETGKLRLAAPHKCRSIYAQLCKSLSSRQKDADKSQEQTISLDEMLNIRETVGGALTAREGFQDYLVGQAREIYEEYGQMAQRRKSNAGIEERRVPCDGAKIRYVASLLLPAYVYTAYDERNQPLLRFEFDAADSVSVTCLRCGEPLLTDGCLADGRQLSFSSFSEEKFTEENRLSEREGFDHFVLAECRETASGNACRRFVCRNESFVCSACGAVLCADCPYPEVVSRRTRKADGGAEVTESLHTSCQKFCCDTLTFLPPQETQVCRCCGQRYSAEAMAGKTYCSFCAPVIEKRDTARLKEIYLSHKLILPYHQRDKRNLCNENARLILFGVYRGKQKERKFVTYEKVNYDGFRAVRLQGDRDDL